MERPCHACRRERSNEQISWPERIEVSPVQAAGQRQGVAPEDGVGTRTSRLDERQANAQVAQAINNNKIKHASRMVWYLYGLELMCQSKRGKQ
ncbi:hypothetical protein chiPu_0023784 [Chiloscyllium punctatum]|uniref:Uncharacterized protein n=1 Tax=Chiloscyllium punctatum TaxID=137246 RepID=A0A401TAK4_CHIPU|nr:hypothetical protein [Chiloscyllium punctatum]